MYRLFIFPLFDCHSIISLTFLNFLKYLFTVRKPFQSDYIVHLRRCLETVFFSIFG